MEKILVSSLELERHPIIAIDSVVGVLELQVLKKKEHTYYIKTELSIITTGVSGVKGGRLNDIQ